MKRLTVAELRLYGVRGSLPAADREFMEFGGNTASHTLRTPSNTLVFLDGGTGILNATEQLDRHADKVVLMITHTHADHLMGLGMCGLRGLCYREDYQGARVYGYGPKGLRLGLEQFYDGRHTWPVRLVDGGHGAPDMPCYNAADLTELEPGAQFQLDESTRVDVMAGNHPVEGGVLLYRFIMGSGDAQRIVVYATDTEFDWIDGPEPYPEAAQFRRRYLNFIRHSDLLLADAQYSHEEYLEQKPRDVRGWGHSYTDQIVELAIEGGVKRLVVTHHGRHNDERLTQREQRAKGLASEDLEVEFGREGNRYEFV